jgi:preprotein translocase subunit YajC
MGGRPEAGPVSRQLAAYSAAVPRHPAHVNASEESTMGSEFGSLLILLLPLLFIGYIFMTQRRRLRQVSDLQSGLKIGDEVRTTSGLFGRVSGLTEAEMVLEIAPGVAVRFDRRAVDAVVPSPSAGPADAPTTDEK